MAEAWDKSKIKEANELMKKFNSKYGGKAKTDTWSDQSFETTFKSTFGPKYNSALEEILRKYLEVRKHKKTNFFTPESPSLLQKTMGRIKGALNSGTAAKEGNEQRQHEKINDADAHDQPRTAPINKSNAGSTDDPKSPSTLQLNDGPGLGRATRSIHDMGPADGTAKTATHKEQTTPELTDEQKKKQLHAKLLDKKAEKQFYKSLNDPNLSKEQKRVMTNDFKMKQHDARKALGKESIKDRFDNAKNKMKDAYKNKYGADARKQRVAKLRADFRKKTKEMYAKKSKELQRSMLNVLAKLPKWLLNMVMLMFYVAVIVAILFSVVKLIPYITLIFQRFRLGNKSDIDDYETNYYNDMHDTLNSVWQGLIDLALSNSSSLKTTISAYANDCNINGNKIDVSGTISSGLGSFDAVIKRYDGVAKQVSAFIDLVSGQYSSKYGKMLVDYSFKCSLTSQTLVKDDGVPPSSYAIGTTTIQNPVLGTASLARNIIGVLRTCMKIEAQRFVNNSGFYSNSIVYAILPPKSTEDDYDAFMEYYITTMDLHDVDNADKAYQMLPTNTFYSAVINNTKVVTNRGFVSQILNEFFKITRSLSDVDDVDFMSIVPSSFMYNAYPISIETDFLSMGAGASVVYSTTFANSRLKSVTFRTKAEFQDGAWIAYIKDNLSNQVSDKSTVVGGTSEFTIPKDKTLLTVLQASYKSQLEDLTFDGNTITNFGSTVVACNAAEGASDMDKLCCEIVQNTYDKWGGILIKYGVNLGSGKTEDFLTNMNTYAYVYNNYDEVCRAVLFALIYKNASSCDASSLMSAYAAVRVYETMLQVLFSYRPAELINVYSPQNVGSYWKYRLFTAYWKDDYAQSVGNYWKSMAHSWSFLLTEVTRISVLVWEYYALDGKNYLPKEIGGAFLFKTSMGDFIRSDGKIEGFADGHSKFLIKYERAEHFSIPGLSGLVSAFASIPKVCAGFIAIFKGISWAIINPVVIVKVIFGLILWLFFALLSTVLFATGIIWLLTLIFIFVFPFLLSIVITVFMTVMYIIIWILYAAVAAVDLLVWSASGKSIAISTMLRKVFTCQPLDNIWYTAPYTNIGNQYQPISFGPLCLGCLKPCPKGYIPVVDSMGNISCTRNELDTDRYTPGGRLFKEVMEPSSRMLIKSMDRVAPPNKNETLNHMDAYRSICKYYEYCATNNGSRNIIRMNCNALFCMSNSFEKDCSCMKDGKTRAGSYLNNILTNVPPTVIKWGMIIGVLVLISAIVASFYYCKMVVSTGVEPPPEQSMPSPDKNESTKGESNIDSDNVVQHDSTIQEDPQHTDTPHEQNNAVETRDDALEAHSPGHP